MEELQEIWKSNKEMGRHRSSSNVDLIQRMRMNTSADRVLRQNLSNSMLSEQIEFLPRDGEGHDMGARIFSRPSRSNSVANLLEPLSVRFSEDLTPDNEPTTSKQRPAITFEREIGSSGKGSICLEYSDKGTGDFRVPSFSVTTVNGSCITPLRYKRHRIVPGKPDLVELPGIRCSADNSTTLIIVMQDVFSGLEVKLFYTCLHDYDGIVRRVEFTNIGKVNEPLMITRAFSMTSDYEADVSSFYMTQLSGSWGRERSVIETKLSHGIQSFGSSRGVSSHQHNPFVAISTGPPSETTGDVKSFTLIYSGNFLIEAEVNEFNR